MCSHEAILTKFQMANNKKLNIRKRFTYSYHLVNDISFSLFQNDYKKVASTVLHYLLVEDIKMNFNLKLLSVEIVLFY
jgi:hypothetical protein